MGDIYNIRYTENRHPELNQGGGHSFATVSGEIRGLPQLHDAKHFA